MILVRSLIVFVAVSFVLAGCGSSQPRAGGGGVGNVFVGGGCSSSGVALSNGQTGTTPTTCAVVFEDGEQFSCPESVTATTPAGVAATHGCRQIAWIRFPPAWKVVLHQITDVRACLLRHGDRVRETLATAGLPGASPNGAQSVNPKLVGELVAGGSSAPAFIGFALHAPFTGGYPPAGWKILRRGNVGVISLSPATVSACAFTS
jgi:hypothetical protein